MFCLRLVRFIFLVALISRFLLSPSPARGWFSSIVSMPLPERCSAFLVASSFEFRFFRKASYFFSFLVDTLIGALTSVIISNAPSLETPPARNHGWDNRFLGVTFLRQYHLVEPLCTYMAPKRFPCTIYTYGHGRVSRGAASSLDSTVWLMQPRGGVSS